MGATARPRRSATIKSRPDGCRNKHLAHTTHQFRRPSCPAPPYVSPQLFRARKLTSALCQSDVQTRSTGRHISGCHHAVLCTNTMDAVTANNPKATTTQGLHSSRDIAYQNCGSNSLSLPLIAKDFSPLFYILPSITWNATQFVRCRVHG